MDLYQSDRLIYRAYEAGDDHLYHAFHADPAVFLNTWKGLPRPVTRNAIERLRKMLDDSLLCVVIYKKPPPSVEYGEPEPIGILSVKSIPADLAHNRRGEIGIKLKSDAHGQGYGTEALSWALGWCFRTANLHQVQLEAYEWNERALKMYKRVGFQEEGRLRQSIWREGRWWDEIIMGILEDEWKAIAASHSG
ncbi:putative GNAT family acetyltransferase [Xylogone sp. PMI_703]|nr:putative GNAT family acetyltransferase [Xylogone sp. PMI_703]